MRTFETRARVRFAETDASGIVYYNEYFVYFELGRIEMFRELGLPYDARVPILETRCRYHAPARFDDPLLVQTFVEEVRTKAFRLGARVLRETDGGEPALLAEGWTVMVTTDDERRPCPLPEAFRSALGAAA
jgi:acyl-CoA thioester hydrolase